MKRFLLLLLVIGLLTGCKELPHKNKELALLEIQEPHPGKKLMEIHCYVCHNPTTGHDDRIAPPMEAVKRHYKAEEVSKSQFIADMKAWLESPSEDNSKMPGAIRNFGLMPYTPIPEKTIEQIADFMYDNDLDTPDWFEDHFNAERGKGMGKGKGHGNGRGKGMGAGMGMHQHKQKNYAELGLEYALSTKAQLGKNLMGAIQKKGTVGAISFCNERAIALTDSMAKVHNSSIKRVSDRPRNQNNKANAVELAFIHEFKTKVANQEEVEPIILERDKSVEFYYPIVTNSMCLQCHGKPEEQVESETLKMLSRLYPKDKATGYDVNQVRGIWSITFNK